MNDRFAAILLSGLASVAWSCGGGGGDSAEEVSSLPPQFAASTFSQPIRLTGPHSKVVGLELERDLWSGSGKAVSISGSNWTVFGANGEVERLYNVNELYGVGSQQPAIGGFYEYFAPVSGGFLALTKGKLVAFNPNRVSQVVRDLPDLPDLFSFGSLELDLSGNVYFSGGGRIIRLDSTGQALWGFDVGADYINSYPAQGGSLVKASNFDGGFEPPFETRLAFLRSNGEIKWQKTFSGSSELGVYWFDSDVPDFVSIGNSMYMGSYAYDQQRGYGLFVLRSDGSVGLFQAQLGSDVLRATAAFDGYGAPVVGGSDLFAATTSFLEGGRFGYLLHVNGNGTQLRSTVLMFEGASSVRLTSASIETSTGDQLAAAVTTNGVHVFRSQTGGQMRWSRVLMEGGAVLSGQAEVAGLANGGALVAFRPEGPFPRPWYLAAVGPEGQSLWSKRFEPFQGLDWLEAQSIPLSDGGVCWQINDKSGQSKQLLVVAGPAGEFRWAKVVESFSVYAAVGGGLSMLSYDYESGNYRSWSIDGNGNANATCQVVPYLAIDINGFLQPSQLSTMSVSLASMPNVFDETSAPIGVMSTDYLLPETAGWQPTQVSRGALCED